MTYDEAFAQVPQGARCTATFGNPGEGGYAEYWRTQDGRRFIIRNGPHDALRPFAWSVLEA